MVSSAIPRGTAVGMSEPERPDLDDVVETHETAHPDRREHAKMPHPVDDDELEARVQQEREETGAGGPVDKN
ncbi:MAG: hypothetical protein ABT15_03105 [Pseudonocardia sp. SCN 73-27]|nr:MAG: hypothetical protein ABS80_06375 [Pseudonocardia sp. SCN 72-51]ODV08280.1 MAG: hypothetical protein ABT15_03105 [Pseudonocardia sp. SCN 73-27]